MGGKLEGKNIADIQKMNRSLVIRTLIQDQSTTRIDITKKTGLNKATVSNIINDLISNGSVRETGLISGKAGRRSIQIEMTAEKYITICVWLTRRHFIVGAYDLYGNKIESERFSVGIYSPVDELMEQILFRICSVKERYKEQVIMGVAVALPGPYIKKKGRIALLTNRSEWQKVDIAQRLRDALDIPVFTQHDSDSAVMAEWMHASRCDKEASLLCVMVSHGIGGGVIDNGRIISGDMGLAGEIGHMSICFDGPKCECGNYGCLEKYCTSFVILDQMKEKKKQFPDTKFEDDCTLNDAVRLYKEKDPLAVNVIDEAARYLGIGLVNMINLFNPKRIVIGDELSEAGERFLEMVKQPIQERVLPDVYENMEIVLSDLSDAVLQGVCISCVDELIKDPELFYSDNETE